MDNLRDELQATFTTRLNLVWRRSREFDATPVKTWCGTHGITRTRLYGWLKGEFMPDAVNLALLCASLDVSADYLLGLENQE